MLPETQSPSLPSRSTRQQSPELQFKAPLASFEDLSSALLQDPTTASGRRGPSAGDETTPSTPVVSTAPDRQHLLDQCSYRSDGNTAKHIFNSCRDAEEQLLNETRGGKEPKDSHYLIYAIFVLHGIGALMPWNMFITAKDYFVEYKLSVEYTGIVSEYATNFLPYVGFASQIPNVIINWVNVFTRIRGSLSARIIWCLVIMTAVFIFTVILAMIDSSKWPGIFFFTTIVSVVILNTANGIYQNTVYGLAAKLPFRYTGAVVLGSNISGTFTALINIMSIATAPNPRTAAIYYFITALFVILACFDTYFALPLSRFFRYHKAKSARINTSTNGDVLTTNCDALMTNCESLRPPYWHIFRRTFPQLVNVFMVFFVTLSVFPTVLADIRPVSADFPVSRKYFVAVLCFLTFNFTAMLGNILPMKFVWPSAKWLWLPVTLRFAFVPFFVMCNYHPVNLTRTMQVYVTNDWVYWVMCGLMGVTSGYFSSLAMMYCPRTVEQRYVTVAGMFGAAALVTGVCCGVQFSLVLSWLVTASV